MWTHLNAFKKHNQNIGGEKMLGLILVVGFIIIMGIIVIRLPKSQLPKIAERMISVMLTTMSAILWDIFFN